MHSSKGNKIQLIGIVAFIFATHTPMKASLQYGTSIANTQSHATKLAPTQSFFIIQQEGKILAQIWGNT